MGAFENVQDALRCQMAGGAVRSRCTDGQPIREPPLSDLRGVGY
jgi:hypothetical protein